MNLKASKITKKRNLMPTFCTTTNPTITTIFNSNITITITITTNSDSITIILRSKAPITITNIFATDSIPPHNITDNTNTTAPVTTIYILTITATTTTANFSLIGEYFDMIKTSNQYHRVIYASISTILLKSYSNAEDNKAKQIKPRQN